MSIAYQGVLRDALAGAGLTASHGFGLASQLGNFSNLKQKHQH
jgi:hypothetical protein